MNSPIIECKNISKSFNCKGNQIKVIDNLNLNIYAKDYIAAIGPSGSGKSTLLYIIGLLLEYDTGDLFLQGKNVYKLKEKQKSVLRNELIGFIFQSYHLLPEFSALENIILPSILKGIPQKIAVHHAEELLEKVNLLHRKDHQPNELSGGEQQRACICRALINKPPIILADEPTGNLDSSNANNIISLLENLVQESNTTLIIVTHNEEISKRANNIIQLIDGQISTKL